MNYRDYKAVITVKSNDGVTELTEFTTWREDIIASIVKETSIPFNVNRDEEMTIVIRPNDVSKWAGRAKDVKYAKPDLLPEEEGVPTVPAMKVKPDTGEE